MVKNRRENIFIQFQEVDKMRKIESLINERFWTLALRKVEEEKGHETFILSSRDKITSNALHTCYYLHDTCLCVFDKMDREFYFSPVSIGSGENNVISQTTKSRLNAIFSTHFNVKFQQKDFILFLGQREIQADKKYRMSDDYNFTEVK